VNPPGTSSSPGAECLARQENQPSGGHIQMRQAWLRPISPAGLTISTVYDTLNLETQLKEQACNTGSGQTGYIEVIDFDLTDSNAANNTATIGYAKFNQDPANAIANGLCMGTLTGWKDVYPYPAMATSKDYTLSDTDMSDSSQYPVGLAPPMAQATNGWTVTPTKATRLDKDFDLTAQSTNPSFSGKTVREEFLARLDKTGDLGSKGFSGVFFYDATTGKSHGYSPIAYQLIYDLGQSGKSLIVVPIREPEIHSVFTDPQHPNCVGVYQGATLDSTSGCQPTDATHPAWQGVQDTTPGEGDGRTDGYFLITELEQIYSSVLNSTLCVVYQGLNAAKAAGWATDTDQRCRGSAKWNPKDSTNGLPPGDWCAATNSAATPSCHDAFKTTAFHAFQGFKVQASTCPAL
jgi:hypothetical protein